jgi:uncharacterized Zn-finger protein
MPQSSTGLALLEIGPSARYGVSADPRAGQARMTDNIVPHFHNDLGVAVIDIGAKEFMCVGALPPFDHPHVYCDMGDDAEYVCPYCSTLYRHDPALTPYQARPAECALNSPAV